MAGFSNVNGDESIVYGDNVSFDGTERGGKVTTNGQLLIGATASPHIRVNTLTAGSGVTIANGAGTITISAGASVPTTFTEDSGSATPVANNLNVLGQKAGTVPVMFTTGSGSTVNIEDRTWTTPFVVDASSTVGLRGTYTTIASALTDAVSGQTIYIRPGTYTENLTLKAGVNLAAWGGSELTPTVTIVGNATATFVGTCSISDIRLQTNAAAFLTVSGSSATTVNLKNCYLNCTNATGISFSSSSSSSFIYIFNCRGDIGTTGISVFAHSGAGILTFDDCYMGVSGNSVTASTVSGSGVLNILHCTMNFPVTTSSTSNMGFYNTYFDMGSLNTTILTCGGSGINTAYGCQFRSGTSSAISVGAGALLTINQCILDSSNTNTMTGLGTVNYTNLSCTQSSIINTTTQNAQYTHLGKYQATGQPCFSAYVGSNVTNATGDGTAVTIIAGTEIFDQNGNYNNSTGTFTAPVTGRYLFSCGCQNGSIGAAHTSVVHQFVTSNRTVETIRMSAAAIKDSNSVISLTGSVIVDMDAADIMNYIVTVFNSTKTVSILGTGGVNMNTYITGKLTA